MTAFSHSALLPPPKLNEKDLTLHKICRSSFEERRVWSSAQSVCSKTAGTRAENLRLAVRTVVA